MRKYYENLHPNEIQYHATLWRWQAKLEIKYYRRYTRKSHKSFAKILHTFQIKQLNKKLQKKNK